MTPADYLAEVKRTAGTHLTLNVATFGLFEEAGEVVGLVKKHIGHGHPLDAHSFAKEVGDCAWYAVGRLLVLGNEEIEPALAYGLQGHFYSGLSMIELCGLLMKRIAQQLDVGDTTVFFKVVDTFRILNAMCERVGLTLNDALEANVRKLRIRYPHGFSSEASIARVDVIPPAPEALRISIDDVDPNLLDEVAP